MRQRRGTQKKKEKHVPRCAEGMEVICVTRGREEAEELECRKEGGF